MKQTRKEHSRGRGAPLLARARVLLVHENYMDMEYNYAVLRSLGYEVAPCLSYADGVRRLREGQWDLVVVSQGGPEFEGRCVLERALELGRPIPVLVVTRCHDTDCYQIAMQLGAADYLEEPVSSWEMDRVLEAHLARQSLAA